MTVPIETFSGQAGPRNARRDRSPTKRQLWALRLPRRHAVLLACLATVLLHLVLLTRELAWDEGGFAMVARHWRESGPYLYGPQWVDRPPALIALFAVADHLGPYGPRLTATLVAILLVAAVAVAAHAVAGRSASGWAAWAAFAFSSSVRLDAQQLNGELAAAAGVAVCMASLLLATRVAEGRAAAAAFGMAAGVSAAGAVLMKQNFVDGCAFAAVLLGVTAWNRRNRTARPSMHVTATAAGLGTGILAVGIAVMAWSRGHGGPNALLYAMYGFRADASIVIADWSWSAPVHRLGEMVLAAVLSGLLVLMLHLTHRQIGLLREPRPLPWALIAAAAVEIFGIAAGQNYWPHYLIALIPTVSLAAGLDAASLGTPRRATRVLVTLAAAATALGSPVAALAAARTPSQAYVTGRWVAASSHGGDSIVVPFTHASLVNASGLEPGYPYAWSLPVRTLDPRLTLLARTLDGPRAPTWVVRWDDPHAWGLDPQDRIDAALRGHYHQVATVCEHAIWLHDGLHRRPAPVPTIEQCGVDEVP